VFEGFYGTCFSKRDPMSADLKTCGEKLHMFLKR
jgi:hypothetical protein